MEGELNNFIRLWLLTILSLSYCSHISSKISKGFPRLVSIFPVLILLLILPFNLHTFHYGSPFVFLLSWLANSKLILFAFGQGPLAPLPPNHTLFILTACSPFKIKEKPVKVKNGKTPFLENEPRVHSMVLEAANKCGLLVLLFCSYNFKQYFHQHVLLILYLFHTYLVIQYELALAAIPAQLMLGVELEPQFKTPVRATSLQDFWGHRWNIRVSDILRPTVYNPVKTISARVIGREWASLPAVLATFFISGLMHELIYFHMTRENPTWEVTWFFILQGILIDVEIVLKKKLVATGKLKLPGVVSGPLALASIAISAGCLSYTQLLRNGVDEMIINEFNDCVEFLKGAAHVL
ncbi:hypothetical protein like AT5G55340 [Hibiscus trionum]|uniref:Wax synthase domain-containing protein n=1 Tax=Hibiscus trionum TaxID=183268 RepID=A0A9W7JBI7_HIBTR|nr:hypothetical protein like AT5G55340 [Hibiscus trionum]